MILEKQTEAHILQEGESQETVKMSLDLDSAQVLMQMLSKNLYSDAIGSTIRECASNALDSHRRAGSDRPIIVSFKRAAKADTFEFAVEDFGIGLDANDVVNIISKYGKSTKRDSNTELGMMGLGFKAPLAYSSSFYFVARKNGVERKYMMYEGEDTNSIDLLYETPTDKMNGVKIIVPVSYYDRNNFTSKIKEQLAYFENVYFDIDNQSTYHTIDNNFTIHRAEHYQYSSLAQNNDMHLCLDNVSYPIDWQKLGINSIHMKLALRFSLSDGLFPTPNREAIRYTQEAKQIILNKIKTVANVFMDKYNESITEKSDIKNIIDYYNSSSTVYMSGAIIGQDGNLDVTRLLEHSTIIMKQPKLEGVELLDLKRLVEKCKDYFLGEYQVKYRYQGGRFNNAKNYWTTNLRPQDISGHGFGGVYIFADRLTKTKQDYLRSVLGDKYHTVYFVKKDKPFTLRSGNQIDYSTYWSILNLERYPKAKWRQLIKELQYVVSLYSKDFIDCDAIEIPQEWTDAKKAKRIKILAKPVTVNGVKKVRMKGEFSGKVGTKTELNLSDQYAKFVPTPYKMEDIHKVNKLHVYAKEADKKQMDNYWSAFNDHVVFVLVAQATYDNLQKADLHNWITIDKFMEGKNRPFKTIATEFLIEDLIKAKRATFSRINVVSEISKDLGDKLNMLDDYNRNNSKPYADGNTKISIIDHAKENNLFDQPVYTVYKQVNEVFEKLPFLDVLLDKMGYRDNLKESAILIAIVDLFKYHKQKVNLEHYKIILTEDAPLEDALTQDTIEKLQTI